MFRTLILTTALLLGVMHAQAQFFAKTVPHFGGMLEFSLGRYPNDPSAFTLSSFYSINLGTYYPVWHTKDIFSVGVDGSAQVGMNFAQVFINGLPRTRAVYSIQAPVFLMARVGSGATVYNQQRVGAGIGAGLMYNTNQLFSQTNINAPLLRLRGNYVTPEVVGQLTVVTRNGSITGRLHFSPVFANSNISQVILPQDIKTKVPIGLGNIGLGLLYGF